MAKILTTLLNGIEFVINFSQNILTPVMNQFSYLYFYNGNIQSLRDEVERLNNKRSYLQLEVSEAERNTRTIASGATEWIKEAEKIAEKEKEIMEYKAQAQKGCFYGILPNIKQRYSVSRKARKTTEAARGLLKNEGIFNKILYPTPLESIPSESSSVSEMDSQITEMDSQKSTPLDVVISFPQLKELHLRQLPRMIQFCHGNDHGIQLPSLESLKITGCELMGTFYRNQSHLPSSQESDSNIMVEDHSFFDAVTCFKLKELDLYELKSVTQIFGPKIIFGNFSRLQRVSIEYCDMRSIFSLPMFKGLVNLQELRLKHCSKLEEVIPKEDKNPQLSQLKEVWLQNLPNIVEFCRIKIYLNLPSLERLTILECPNLISFCTIETKIHLEEGQILFHQRIRNLLRLEYLQIKECNGVVNFFPSFIYGEERIPNLKILSISTCEMLQEVIGKKYEDKRRNFKITWFPRLKELELYDLPNLKQFGHFNVEFPSLERLTIGNCKLMETFFGGEYNFTSSSQVLDFKSLFTEVTRWTTLERGEVFKGLKYLLISHCERLKSIFSPNMFKGLVNLKILKVSSCSEVKVIISKNEKEVETIPTKTEIIFPQLETLTLWDLPKLVRFCHIKNDLELPSLMDLDLRNCVGLESFSLGAVHLPSSVRIDAYDLGSIEGMLSNELFLTRFSLSISDN